MYLSPEDLLKLLLAVVAGGAIGLERELHHKAAGFRTLTLICIGAALITLLDGHINGAGRLMANIVTGVGFLGAGVIMHEASRIRGLTTASAVWVSAALGMAIGAGAYFAAAVGLVVVMLVMTIFLRMERWIDSRFDFREYEITLKLDLAEVERIEAMIRSYGLHIGRKSRMKRADCLVAAWDVSGLSTNQERFVQAAVTDPEILSVEW